MVVGYSKRRENSVVLCYKCGKFGTLKFKSHKSYFYPQYSSVSIINLGYHENLLAHDPNNEYERKMVERLRKKIKGSMYSSEANKRYGSNEIQGDISDTYRDIIKEDNAKQKSKDSYAIKYKTTELYPCVYHYDHAKYIQEKQEYNNGLRKSKPSGVIWHYYRPPGHVDRRKKTRDEILHKRKQWKSK